MILSRLFRMAVQRARYGEGNGYMHDLKLFVAPGSCARVPTIALEEIGVPFETELVRTAANQQKSADYLKINPKGKVPALVIDGQILTENVAILGWLNRMFPGANLLPSPRTPLEESRQVADLAFFSGTVHPTVTRIAMPIKFIEDADASFDLVRPKGVEAMEPIMAMINERLADQPWWYGDTWSIVDAYFFWTWWRIGVVGYDQSPFPNLVDHERRIMERPSVQRAMEREAVNIEILKAEGNYRAPR